MELVSELIGQDVQRLLRAGGPTLFRTEVLQPILVADALADFASVTEPVEAVAGHSAGEIAAWSAAGGISAEDAVRLARARGLAMATVARQHPGGMVARHTSDPPPGLVLAAHNTPDTWIFSGLVGALRGPTVAVGGPWHHPVMRAALPEFAAAIAATPQTPLTRIFVSNRRALPEQDPVPGLLEQLDHPVLWVQSMRSLAGLGVRRVRPCGVGRELAAWARACVPSWTIER